MALDVDPRVPTGQQYMRNMPYPFAGANAAIRFLVEFAIITVITLLCCASAREVVCCKSCTSGE